VSRVLGDRLTPEDITKLEIEMQERSAQIVTAWTFEVGENETGMPTVLIWVMDVPDAAGGGALHWGFGLDLKLGYSSASSVLMTCNPTRAELDWVMANFRASIIKDHYRHAPGVIALAINTLRGLNTENVTISMLNNLGKSA
jgi:hypothetical protein